MTDKQRKALTLFEDYHSMMSDQVRLSAYARAITEVVREGDVVIDLGAGLGILSFLALGAGARRVYAIEKSDSIALARQVADKNGLADKITFIEELSTRVELPEKADVLLSETLGSFAVDENTLAFTIDARDRLLVPGGRMIPRSLELFLAPARQTTRHGEHLFWNDIAGFDYSAALDAIAGRMSLADMKEDDLMAESQSFATLDLTTITSPQVANKLVFPVTKAGAIHGLTGHFQATLADGIEIHTGPGRPATHWRQAFFPYREPVSVIVGDFMEVTLAIGPGSGPADDTEVHYDFRCTQLANEPSPPRRSAPSASPPHPPLVAKVGRNERCPCGSGKKHKRCCWP